MHSRLAVVIQPATANRGVEPRLQRSEAIQGALVQQLRGSPYVVPTCRDTFAGFQNGKAMGGTRGRGTTPGSPPLSRSGMAPPPPVFRSGRWISGSPRPVGKLNRRPGVRGCAAEGSVHLDSGSSPRPAQQPAALLLSRAGMSRLTRTNPLDGRPGLEIRRGAGLPSTASVIASSSSPGPTRCVARPKHGKVKSADRSEG